MKLLFDENTPFSLARDLTEHECHHVIRLGWRGIKNGALLTRAELSGFDALVTLDDDMGPEQNMANRNISVLVVKTAKQGKVAMREMAPRVLASLAVLKPGEIRVVSDSDAE